ncbi:unnamed protein product, partial [Heterotrigona itama]
EIVELEIYQNPDVPERFKNQNKAWRNPHRWQPLLVTGSRKLVVPYDLFLRMKRNFLRG